MLKLALAFILTSPVFADVPLRETSRPPRIRFQVQRELGKFELTTYPGKTRALTSSLYYQDGKFGYRNHGRPFCSIFIHHTGNQIAPMPNGWVSITMVRVHEAVSGSAGSFRHDNQAALHFTYSGRTGSLDCQAYTENSRPMTLADFQENFGDLIRIERY